MQIQEPTCDLPTVDLSIVIVSWNVWPLLRQCLVSIEETSTRQTSIRQTSTRQTSINHTRKQGDPEGGRGEEEASPSEDCVPPLTLEVIVVDNASSDNTPALVAEHFPWVRIIASDENLGFTGGNNRGYAASHGRFVFFLNPDTELAREGEKGRQGDKERDSPLSNHPTPPLSHSPSPPLSPSPLLALFTAIAADPSIGVIGPRLLYGDGSPQPSARRFPVPLTGFFESTWLGRAWPANPWARTMLMTAWPADRAGDVDWLVGAAMLCRRQALAGVLTPDGPFDEGFFMYSEEMDLCRRIHDAGWRIVYDPAATIIHHEGKSSEQVSTRRHILFNTSKVRYWRKWFGPRWSEALRRYLLLEYHVQLWIERAKLQVGSKPEMRRARIAAYRQVIASGLTPDIE